MKIILKNEEPVYRSPRRLTAPEKIEKQIAEEYEYRIEHRKGSQMSHVDALTDNPVVMVITEDNSLI